MLLRKRFKEIEKLNLYTSEELKALKIKYYSAQAILLTGLVCIGYFIYR